MADSMGYTTRERWFVAVSAMFGFGLDFYNLVIMAFLLLTVQNTLHMSAEQAGLIVAVSLGSSVLGGILIGWLGDRIGRKNALMATLIFLAAGALLSALAWDFTSLLIFRVIAGIGVGGEWGAGIVLFNEVWTPTRRGLGSALVQAMAAAGTALAAIVSAWALGSFSPDTAWRVAMAVGALPLVLMLVVRTWMPESRLWEEYHRRLEAGDLPAEKLNEGNSLVEIMKGASLRYFVLGVLMCAGYFFAYQAITTFMPSLMIRAMGATPAVVRDVSLLWSVVLAVGMLCTGWISDAYGRKWSVVLATLVGVAGYVALWAVGSVKYPGTELGGAVFWAYALWGFAQGSGGQFGPWMSELYPTELRATAASTIYTAGRLVGAASPFLVPVFAGVFGGNLLKAMMIGVAGSVVSLVCALALPETAGRAFAVVEGREHDEAESALAAATGRN